MTATNHALTGALIGLSIANPVLAIPLAFVSHFVLDAVPHYDRPAVSELNRLRSRRFWVEQLLVGGGLCVLLVIILALARPTHWLAAAICAFVATSPDLTLIPKFVIAKKHKRLIGNSNWLLRFHSRIQWSTSPQGVWVELAWFTVASVLLVGYL